MDDMNARVTAILQELGIDVALLAQPGFRLHSECRTLVDTEPDVFGRQQRLDVEAHAAWQAMKAAAGSDGIELQIVSAFRSIDYQRELFLRKLARGDSIDSILRVNAAPGFSEHHSGCALDLGTPGFPYLEESFEQSQAFAWLARNAAAYGFHLSFPRDNHYGVVYEPWHWCYRKDAGKEGVIG
jgi:D-alanyl-D-alanine carboxypeptidase